MSLRTTETRSVSHYCPGCQEWGDEAETTSVTASYGATTICWSCRDVLDNLGLSD